MRKSVSRFPASFVYATAAILPPLAISSMTLAAESSAGNQTRGVALSAERSSGNYSVESLRRQIGLNLLIVGPVAAIDSRSGVVEILGQLISVPQESAHFLTTVRVGQVLAISGDVSSEGAMRVNQIVEVPTEYVDGASEVLVTGRLTELHESTASAKIGSLAIDYSPAMHSGKLNLSKGAIAQLTGIRTAGSTARLIAFGAIAGSIGSGHVQGSMGSGTTGSMGSGTAGSMGSGTAGSMGSGTAGSMGSGTAGSMGRGTTGSMGSGTVH